MTRKICVVTGSRAEYGLLRWVMEGVRSTQGLELQVIATGMHLSPEFGLTYREIERDGFVIDRKVDMLLSSDTPTGIAKSMGVGLIVLADAIQQLRPDVVVVLGDRFEIFAAAAAASVACVPLAHLHGGEATEGAFDEGFRHSITKMSHLHFVAAEEYRNRVIQLGEHPDRVFLVGGLGIDSIKNLKLLERSDLEADLGVKFQKRNLLITFHPATLDGGAPAHHMEELLAAVESIPETQLLFTMPNADTDGRELCAMVRTFVETHSNARAFTSLGQVRYLSCLRVIDGVVGNSSSGLTEVPSFRKGTINIGDRQRGRLRAASVIDCRPERKMIASAIERLYSSEFQATLRDVKNPYGEGGASEKVVHTLKSYPLDGIVKKTFHNLAPSSSVSNPL